MIDTTRPDARARRLLARKKVKRLLSTMEPVLRLAVAALAGAALWHTMRLAESAARPVLSAAPEWLALAANAGIEEALRLALALAATFAIRRLQLEPGTATLAVAASCVMAALENAGYLAAFPTFDTYWRLGYAVPVHAGAAALYAIATAPEPPARPQPEPNRNQHRRNVAIAASFAAAWTWHAGFNIVAALAPFTALPLVGTALNLITLTALVAALALRYGYWSIYATR